MKKYIIKEKELVGSFYGYCALYADLIDEESGEIATSACFFLNERRNAYGYLMRLTPCWKSGDMRKSSRKYGICAADVRNAVCAAISSGKQKGRWRYDLNCVW